MGKSPEWGDTIFRRRERTMSDRKQTDLDRLAAMRREVGCGRMSRRDFIQLAMAAGRGGDDRRCDVQPGQGGYPGQGR